MGSLTYPSNFDTRIRPAFWSLAIYGHLQEQVAAKLSQNICTSSPTTKGAEITHHIHGSSKGSSSLTLSQELGRMVMGSEGEAKAVKR